MKTEGQILYEIFMRAGGWGPCWERLDDEDREQWDKAAPLIAAYLRTTKPPATGDE